MLVTFCRQLPYPISNCYMLGPMLTGNMLLLMLTDQESWLCLGFMKLIKQMLHFYMIVG